MNSRDWLVGHGITPYAALVETLDDALEEQRQMCADEAVSEVSCYDVSLGTIRGVREACLNAGERE